MWRRRIRGLIDRLWAFGGGSLPGGRFSVRCTEAPRGGVAGRKASGVRREGMILSMGAEGQGCRGVIETGGGGAGESEKRGRGESGRGDKGTVGWGAGGAEEPRSMGGAENRRNGDNRMRSAELRAEPRDGSRKSTWTEELRRTVEERIIPGLESLRNASRELSPVLATRQRQLEEAAGRLSQPIRSARQEIHLATPTAHPGLDPSEPYADPLPFELLRDLAGPEPTAAFGTRFLREVDHRPCPRLDGVTHHGGCGVGSSMCRTAWSRKRYRPNLAKVAMRSKRAGSLGMHLI